MKKSKRSSKRKSRRLAKQNSGGTAQAFRQRIADLEKERRIDRFKLQVVREIGRISHARTSLDQILSRTMNLALKALKTDAGTLFLFDAAEKELVFRVVKGSQKTVDKLTGRHLALGEGIVGHVVKTGKPYVTFNARRDRKWQKKVSDDLGYQTNDILCVPLRSGRGKIQGAIEVINRKDAVPYSGDDLEVLESIADQVGIVVENAKLFYDVQRRMQNLSDLHRVSGILTSRLDRISVRKNALKAVVDLMDCETGSLFQVDLPKKELFIDVVLGEDDEVLKKVRLKMGEGAAGWVAQHKKPLIIADCKNDRRFSQKVDRISKFRTRNMICSPLIFEGELLGVLQALNRRSGTFASEDLVLFSDLANQVAIALKNALLYERMQKTFYESVTALAEAIELRDPYTGGHTQRVRRYSLAIGRHLGLNVEEMERLSLSAILHDIGKIGVEDRILRKKGKLDYDEFLEMKKHPDYGFQILQHVPGLAMTYDGVLYHHERFDGKGYPRGLKGKKIPLIARIIAVADTFDAMTTNRPYRDGLQLEFVLKELRQCAGNQFDPEAVAAFQKAYRKKQIVLD